ncbi:MAG: NPCBM/NEW2 domain-containing protein [Gemmataceae bacterium]
MMQRLCVLAASCSLFLTGFGLAAEPRLTTIDGKTVQGELVNVTPTEVLLKTTKMGEVATPNDKVLDLDMQRNSAAPKNYLEVELVDGTVLKCSDFQVKQKEVEVKLTSGQQIKLPLASIVYMVRDAHDSDLYKKFREFVSGQGSRDIFVANSAGTLQPLEGTLRSSAMNDKIHFTTQTGSEVDLPLERVHGLVFLRKREAVSEKTLFKLHDTARNVLVVEKSEKTAAGFKVTTVCGAVAEFPLDQLAKLDFNKGQLTYLSNIRENDFMPKLLKVVEKSSLGGVDHYRRDKNLDGGKIRLQNKPYDKGLSMHAYTELVYEIGGDFKEFKAVMGIDDQVGGDSHVKVTVEGDDQELFSAELSRQDRKTIPIAINITGKKKLRIVVRSVNLIDLGDHVTLAEARLTK